MRRVAFATSAAYAVLSADDRLAVEALEGAGVAVEAAVWDDARVRWDAFDRVVIRSCWDYHLRHEEFLAWLGGLERAGVPLSNAPGLVRWNLEKTYLADLGRRGVAVPETAWAGRGASVDLAALLAERGWDRAVVKPTVSASAYETWVTSPASAAADSARLARLLERSGVMVQPFLDAVVRGGEWSLVYFDGRLSHAVLKRPAAGDFRVQAEFGGSCEAAAPPGHLLEGAARVLASLAERPLYARVDGVDSGGELLLMELELIDPYLFFGLAPGSAALFADALAGAATTASGRAWR